MSPPIFSTRMKEKPREYLTREDVHSMLTRATMGDDIDMNAENMAIASGGWCKQERSQTTPNLLATSHCSDRMELNTTHES
jgi:hypothetical protein